MKISIQVLGSLGDVMPYVSTALELQAQGAEVSILAPRDFTSLIRSHGIIAPPAAQFSLQAWMDEAERRGTLNNPISFFRDWRCMIQPHINDVMAKCLEAGERADLIVANLICAPARIAAEAHNVPFMLTSQQPVLSPTKDQPCAMMWRPWHGDRFNRAGYRMISLANRVIGHSLKQHRKQLGLPARPQFSDIRTHLGQPLPKVSSIPWPVMRERPRDWGRQDYLTAYPSLPISAANEMSSGLMDFLASGSRPVYVGLGSLGSSHGRTLLDAAIAGLQQVGLRGLISKSMAGTQTKLPDQFRFIDHEPHDQVFQHCTAVMHHGGAGTSDTALRAGVPQILQPHFLDQFWFAAQLKKLGLAPDTLPMRNLTHQDVADAVTFTQTHKCKERVKIVRQGALARSGTKELSKLILSQLITVS